MRLGSVMASQQREFVMCLHIAAAEVERYYRGAAQAVRAVAEDGTRVRFPAESLRPYVTRDGVHGRFRMRVSADNRILAFEFIGDD